MVYAKIHITYPDGASRICEAESKEDLGQQLNSIQNDIEQHRIFKAMVESDDPIGKTIADMFNSMASDLEKLKNTQKILYNSANR